MQGWQNEESPVGCVQFPSGKDFSILFYMNNKEAVLEYHVNKETTDEGQWGFRFKDSNGEILIDSSGYPTLAQAEQGFLALVKSIATNRYSVSTPDS